MKDKIYLIIIALLLLFIFFKDFTPEPPVIQVHCDNHQVGELENRLDEVYNILHINGLMPAYEDKKG